jgi:hypothetical protein
MWKKTTRRSQVMAFRSRILRIAPLPPPTQFFKMIGDKSTTSPFHQRHFLPIAAHIASPFALHFGTSSALTHIHSIIAFPGDGQTGARLYLVPSIYAP